LNAKHTSYINISRFDTNGNFHKDKQEILQFFVTFTKLNKKFCSFFHKDKYQVSNYRVLIASAVFKYQVSE
jgi:hypothetical protein